MVRPVRVAIPYSMFSAERESHSVCFFCRTEDKEKLDGQFKYISNLVFINILIAICDIKRFFVFKGYFKAYPFSGLGDIISITQVRKLYAAYKDRKKLLSEHTHFACDARVMTQLYNLLGKTFGSKNNYPIPIEFETNAKLPAALQVRKIQKIYFKPYSLILFLFYLFLKSIKIFTFPFTYRNLWIQRTCIWPAAVSR